MMELETLDSVLGLMLKERLRSLSVTEGNARISVRLSDEAFKQCRLGPEIVVRSHAIGRYLGAHPSEANSKVRSGTVVHSTSLVGFLQIDAILLPLRAGCSGTVKEVHVQDGALLGYGDPILTVRAES